MADDYEPLEKAVYNKSPELLESLLKTASSRSIRWITEDVSVCVHNFECLRVLLKYITTIDAVDGAICGNHTMLTKAADTGQLDCIRLLLEHGANVNARNGNNETAFMYACNDKHKEVFDFLLKQGADIHAVGPNGNAIGMAAHRNAVNCLHELVTLGADLYEKNCCGKTAFLVACECGHEDFVNALSNYVDLETEMGNLYQGANAYDLDARDDDGKTSLMHSCENGHAGVLKLLLNSRPNINARDGIGRTAVMYAALKNNLMCVQVLVKEGADLDIVDDKGFTVFSFAVRGEGKVLEFLLQNGSVLCDGVLKPCHKDSIWRSISEEIYFTFHNKSMLLLLDYGIFDWDWCVQTKADPLDTFITPAVRRSLNPRIMTYKGFKMSMLPLAFAQRDAPAIKFLLANRFFFPGDYRLLSKNKAFRKEMKTGWNNSTKFSKYSAEVTQILKKLTFKTLSLQTWSFLTLSKALSRTGDSDSNLTTGRADQVDALPLPEQMKKALKFQTGITELCPRQWKNITVQQVFDSLSLKEDIVWDKVDMKCTIQECLECDGDYISFKVWVEC